MSVRWQGPGGEARPRGLWAAARLWGGVQRALVLHASLIGCGAWAPWASVSLRVYKSEPGHAVPACPVTGRAP